MVLKLLTTPVYVFALFFVLYLLLLMSENISDFTPSGSFEEIDPVDTDVDEGGVWFCQLLAEYTLQSGGSKGTMFVGGLD